MRCFIASSIWRVIVTVFSFVVRGKRACDELAAERLAELASTQRHALLPARPIRLDAAQVLAVEREVLGHERRREIGRACRSTSAQRR